MVGARARISTWGMLWLVTAAICSTSLASAQAAPTEAEVAEARRIFAVGIEHADHGRWEDAVVCFRQVLEVREAPPVLYNLGAALVALNQYPEAEPLLRRVVDDPSADPSLVERARASLARIAERGGRVTIHLVGASPGTVVLLDGLVLGRDQIDVDIPLSAGTHEVIARDGADERARRTLRITAGERAELTLDASTTASIAEADVSHAESEAERAAHTELGTSIDTAGRRRRLARNPWLWTGVGVGAVVLGAVIIAVAHDPPVDDPVQGNSPPGLIRF